VVEALERAVASGARVVSSTEDVGDGIEISYLIFPNGEGFGLISNPNFKIE
jgi:predicted enzyme related to lactoylglutathione lyase